MEGFYGSSPTFISTNPATKINNIFYYNVLLFSSEIQKYWCQ